MRRLLGYVVLLVLLSVVAFERLSLASFGGGEPRISPRNAELSPELRQRDIARIISVFEGRVGDGNMPVKAKVKLLAMADEELRLMTSLCDRIDGAANRAGADVALLLVTAMIVLT